MDRALSQADIYAIPQFPAQDFIVDFAILLESGQRIAVECDGERWHSSAQARKRDGWKTHCLHRAGWTVIRFTGKEIDETLPGCIDRIKELIETL